MFIIHCEKNYEIDNNKHNEDPNNKSVENLEKYHSYLFSYISEYQQITKERCGAYIRHTHG